MPPKNQRWWLTTDSQSIEIDAPADRIYDLVADMPRMGEWSNECARVEWTNGATGAAPNATFLGHNYTGPRGIIKWSRKGRVLTADRGREFAFDRTEPFAGTVRWRYLFEPEGTGTRVTESYEVTKDLTVVGWFIIGTLYGRKDRRTEMRASMLATLDRVAELTEAPASV